MRKAHRIAEPETNWPTMKRKGGLPDADGPPDCESREQAEASGIGKARSPMRMGHWTAELEKTTGAGRSGKAGFPMRAAHWIAEPVEQTARERSGNAGYPIRTAHWTAKPEKTQIIMKWKGGFPDAGGPLNCGARETNWIRM